MDELKILHATRSKPEFISKCMTMNDSATIEIFQQYLYEHDINIEILTQDQLCNVLYDALTDNNSYVGITPLIPSTTRKFKSREDFVPPMTSHRDSPPVPVHTAHVDTTPSSSRIRRFKSREDFVLPPTAHIDVSPTSSMIRKFKSLDVVEPPGIIADEPSDEELDYMKLTELKRIDSKDLPIIHKIMLKLMVYKHPLRFLQVIADIVSTERPPHTLILSEMMDYFVYYYIFPAVDYFADIIPVSSGRLIDLLQKLNAQPADTQYTSNEYKMIMLCIEQCMIIGDPKTVQHAIDICYDITATIKYTIAQYYKPHSGSYGMTVSPPMGCYVNPMAGVTPMPEMPLHRSDTSLIGKVCYDAESCIDESTRARILSLFAGYDVYCAKYITTCNTYVTNPEHIQVVYQNVGNVRLDDLILSWDKLAKLFPPTVCANKQLYFFKCLSHIMSGLLFFNNNYIFHGDLHCGNIMLDNKMHPKFIDFGMMSFYDPTIPLDKLKQYLQPHFVYSRRYLATKRVEKIFAHPRVSPQDTKVILNYLQVADLMLLFSIQFAKFTQKIVRKSGEKWLYNWVKRIQNMCEIGTASGLHGDYNFTNMLNVMCNLIDDEIKYYADLY